MDDWATLWAVARHWLWRWHNQQAHDPQFTYPSRPWIVIQRYVKKCKTATELQRTVNSKLHIWTQVLWKPQCTGWVVINTDGAARLGSNKAGCGGLLRNSDGGWLCGFSKKLGNTTAYVAELWGVPEALKIAKERGYPRVELRMDSKVVADCLKGKSDGSFRGWSLIKEIKKPLN